MTCLRLKKNFRQYSAITSRLAHHGSLGEKMPRRRKPHGADIGPLELDIPRERDGDGAGRGETALETGEDLIERAKAAGKQAMWVPILRRAGARSGGCHQPVARAALMALACASRRGDLGRRERQFVQILRTRWAQAVSRDSGTP
jgi:hypothetical protein